MKPFQSNEPETKEKKNRLKLFWLFLIAPKNLPLVASLIGGTALVTTGTILLANQQSSNPVSSSEVTSSATSSNTIPSSVASSETTSSSSTVQFTVTFVTNGGTAVADIQVNQNGLISAPSTTNGIFTLEGWYLSTDNGSTLGEEWDFASDLVTTDLTLYANWVTPIAPIYNTFVPGRRYMTYKNETGTIYSWGQNNDGSTGVGNNTRVGKPVAIQIDHLREDEEIIHLTAGRQHTLALTSEYRVFGWGDNGDHQLAGIQLDEPSEIFVPGEMQFPMLDADESISFIAAGYYHSYFLTSKGRVFGVGYNNDGILGVNDDISENVETHTELTFALEPSEYISKIDIGEYHGFATSNLGRVFGWGEHSEGQLGFGDFNIDAGILEYYITPQLLTIPGLANDEYIDVISASENATIFSTNKHRLFGTGVNDFAKIINTNPEATEPYFDTIYEPTLMAIDALEENEFIVEVELGDDHTNLLTNLGNIINWGDNEDAQIGRPAETSYLLTPTKMPFVNLELNEKVINIEVYEHSNYALTNLNHVYVWGVNGQSQLGLGYVDDDSFIFEPTLVEFSDTKFFVDIHAGTHHSLALTSNGDVYGWGYNYNAAVGVGESRFEVNSPTLIPIPGLNPEEKVINLYTRIENSYAITNQGRLFGWGRNFYGELGVGDTNSVFSPTLITIPNLSLNEKVIEVVSNSYATFVLTNLGRLFGMGASYSYLIGGNNSDFISTPTLYTALTLNQDEKVVQVYMGGNHVMVLTSSDRLFTWGLNESAQFGNGTNEINLEYTISPILVPLTFLNSGESISMISLGKRSNFALTSDGRLFGWGINNNGELGIAASDLELTPVLIPIAGLNVDETIVSVESGLETATTYILTSEGRTFGWGDNAYSQVGISQDESTFVGTPTLINYTTLRSDETIVQINFVSEHTLAITSDGRIYGFGSEDDYRLGNYDNFGTIRVPIIIIAL